MDRSDEVIVDMIERVCRAQIFRRMPEEQRDVRDAKSARDVARQQNSVETVEGELVTMACVVSV